MIKVLPSSQSLLKLSTELLSLITCGSGFHKLNFRAIAIDTSFDPPIFTIRDLLCSIYKMMDCPGGAYSVLSLFDSLPPFCRKHQKHVVKRFEFSKISIY